MSGDNTHLLNEVHLLDQGKVPRFIYIQKGALKPFHALQRSIKKECYQDIRYYANKLLREGMKVTDFVQGLRANASVCVASVCVASVCVASVCVASVCVASVYATTHDDCSVMHSSSAMVQRLTKDPVLIALAYSDIDVKEINAYIKAQLTAEEMEDFIGDTLTEEEIKESIAALHFTHFRQQNK